MACPLRKADCESRDAPCEHSAQLHALHADANARLLRGAVVLLVGLVLLSLAGARLESVPGWLAVLWGLTDVGLGGYTLLFDKKAPGPQPRLW
jgi:hypothetical protein